MPRAAYSLELELSYNTWTDVTADLHAAIPVIIERGIEPGERVAKVGRMTLALYNPDGRYTPGHAAAIGGFEVGIGVRLEADDGMDTHTLFYGRLAAINPSRSAGAQQAAPLQKVELTVLDDMAAVHRARLETFPLLTNVGPKELVNRLVDTSFTPPGLFDYWRLGHPGASELGQTTTLPNTYTGKDFAAGQSVFPWAGDTWRGEFPLGAALRDVMTSEGGYFYITADGTPTFADRHTRPKHVTADATLSGSLAGLAVERAHARVANRVEITAHPRDDAASPEVLWESQHRIRLMPGVPRVVLCRYIDPDQEAIQVGALDVIPPVAGTDYTATDAADGSGTDATDAVSIAFELGAASARLTLVSGWPLNQPIYVHTLRVRGKPLRTYQPVTVVLEDEASRIAFGPLPLRLDMPLQDDAAVAGDMACALLANRKDPHPWLTVRVEATAGASLLAHALARDVGDRLSVTDPGFALDEAACFIDAVRHVIRRGGASHVVEWRTSPADLEAWWVLGQSGYAELGQATRLGY